MSMLLFNIYMNDLTVNLRRRELGSSWCDIYVGCPTYADDMIMLMRNNGELQEACVVVNKFSSDWRLKYNAKKSYILDKMDGVTDVVVRLGEDVVPSSAVIKHLGSKIDIRKKNNWVGLEETVGRAKTLCYSFMGLGTKNAQMHLITLSNLYWKVAMPSFLYGVENITIQKKEEGGISRSCCEALCRSPQYFIRNECSQIDQLALYHWNNRKEKDDIPIENNETGSKGSCKEASDRKALRNDRKSFPVSRGAYLGMLQDMCEI